MDPELSKTRGKEVAVKGFDFMDKCDPIKGKSKQAPDVSDDENIPLRKFVSMATLAPSLATPTNEKNSSSRSKKHVRSEHKQKREKIRRTAKEKETSHTERTSKKKHKREKITLSLIEDMKFNEKYSMKATIIRLWHGQIYGLRYGEVIAFLAFDEQQKRIEFHINDFLASKWAQKLKEGHSYLISNVQLSETEKITKLLDKPYQLMFNESTTVTELNSEVVPASCLYNFKKLSDLPTLHSTPNTLRDFLLYVVDIHGPTVKFKRNSKESFKLVDVYVLDKSMPLEHVLLTMWEDTFMHYEDHFTKGSHNQFIVAATGLKTNEYEGKIGLKTTNFTRFEFEPDLPEAQEMYNCILNAYTQPKQPVLKIESSQQGVPHPDTNTAIAVAELNRLGEIGLAPAQKLIYTAQVEITHVYTEWGITYSACTVCTKQVVVDKQGKNICPDPHCSNRSGASLHRYRIKVQAQDSTGTAIFTLFDRQAFDVLQITADEAMQIKDEPTGLSKLQKIFAKAIGNTYNFKIKVDERNITFARKHQYTVQNISWAPRAFQPTHLSPKNNSESTSGSYDGSYSTSSSNSSISEREIQDVPPTTSEK